MSLPHRAFVSMNSDEFSNCIDVPSLHLNVEGAFRIPLGTRSSSHPESGRWADVSSKT